VIDQQPEPQPLMSPAEKMHQHAMSAADMCGKYAMPAVDMCGKCVESLREIPLINFTCDFAVCLVECVYWWSAFANFNQASFLLDPLVLQSESDIRP
jgi:hypothetical protein